MKNSFLLVMRALSVLAPSLVLLVVKAMFSHGREEGTGLPHHEGRMESTEQSSYIDKRGYEEEVLSVDSDVKGLQYKTVKKQAERLNDGRVSEKVWKPIKSPRKRSHPYDCPPGWISPWDYAGSHGLCSSNCGSCDAGFGGDGFDSGCGCDECVGCGGCCGGYDGCECGKFHGGVFRPGGRRFPRLFNEGGVQHVWLSK